MSANIVNKSPYVRNSRTFPEEMPDLSLEINRTYIDLARAVNDRTIGIFPSRRPAVTGNTWFIRGQTQQTLRQVYPFTAAGNIAHGIDFTQIDGFVQIYGTFTDGTNWYPLPYVSDLLSTTIMPPEDTNQVSLYVDSTNIVITASPGALTPGITRGFVVLEWQTTVSIPNSE